MSKSQLEKGVAKKNKPKALAAGDTDGEREVNREGGGHGKKSKALITLADEDEESDDHGYIRSAKAKAKLASPPQSAKPLPVELTLSGNPRKKDIETAERDIMGRGAKGNENAGDSALTDEETADNGDLPAKLATLRRSLSPCKTKSGIPSHTKTTAMQKRSMSRFCRPKPASLESCETVKPPQLRRRRDVCISAKRESFQSPLLADFYLHGDESKAEDNANHMLLQHTGSFLRESQSEPPLRARPQKSQVKNETQGEKSLGTFAPVQACIPEVEAVVTIEKALPLDILDRIKQSAVRHLGMGGGDDSDPLDCPVNEHPTPIIIHGATSRSWISLSLDDYLSPLKLDSAPSFDSTTS
ncbi:hypothetical protein HYDPIDRAFT_31001 [Hydnomerulius pinastri MD-312]|uniref:Uncharacterized protein n=1 Tax=Hydnomerulius pinastri MD-312 TaxID=994086 RepID=A0A0C9W525_9AGAM|nr:hypothetical protein HYDPIDRAFT_31001 [Hydnomerulius pinastri MD-312]